MIRDGSHSTCDTMMSEVAAAAAPGLVISCLAVDRGWIQRPTHLRYVKHASRTSRPIRRPSAAVVLVILAVHRCQCIVEHDPAAHTASDSLGR